MSVVQPLDKGFLVFRKNILFHFLLTITLSIIFSFLTTAILPSSGMLVKIILQPIHPFLLAFSERGFLFSMMDEVTKNFGITHRFFINHSSLEYCIKKKLGVELRDI